MCSDGKNFEFCRSIEKLLPEFLNKKSTHIHKTLKELYRLIQLNETKVDSPNSLSQHEQDIIFSVIQYLISILSNPIFPVDSLLLSGTCLSVLVANLFAPNYASILLISLYFQMGKQTANNSVLEIENETNEKNVKQKDLQDILSDCNIQNGNLNKKMQQIFQEKNTSMNNSKITFQQIAILHGILSYQKDELFLYKSPFFNNAPFLISLFDFIHLSCILPCTSQYHAFSVLQSWLRVCETHLEKILFNSEMSSETIFSSETKVVTKLLLLLESNWESPIKGVSAFVKECYKLIISLSISESKTRNLTNFDLAKYLTDQIMKLSWQMKGKYLVLSIILQFIDYKKFLIAYPDVPKEVILNLRANYSSSAVSEVYKSIVLAIKNWNSSEEDIYSEWCKWWKESIVTALDNDDKSLIQNVINLILPWSLKTLPKSYDFLLEDLVCKKNILSQLTLLRVAKESGILILGIKEIKLLQKYLHHREVRVRCEILSILCSSPKKSESLSTEELALLKDFITVNLNIDSTPFQQQLLSQLRTLFVRIRDSLVQDYRLISKNSKLHMNYSQLEFIQWLAQTSLVNTYPGACFQRRRTCLLILTNIFDVFIESVCGSKKKEKPSKLVEKVIHQAKSRNLWMFLTDDSLLKILPCLTDFTDEIRSITFDLLVKYSKWPAIEDKSTIFNREFITSSAQTLCNHPDYRSNEAGAYLYCLILKRIYLNDRKANDVEGYKQALNFMCEIVESAKFQLHFAKQNFLVAASTYPIHGVLLALQYCLSSFIDTVEKMFQTEIDKTRNLFDSTLHLCDDIIQYMLHIMKGNEEKDNCPSFMSIGMALEKLIVSQQSDLSSENTVWYQCEEKKKIIVKPNHSELELLLSCCWHSIKNSCSLLCELSLYYYKIELDSSRKKHYLKFIAFTLSSILKSCRHRGVVDACSLSLNKFCTSLLEDEAIHDEICKYLLNMVFESLSDASSTSVTRRSAGLPSLCQAIVSSEKSNINRRLLSFTVEALLTYINQPLPPSMTISDKTDLPHAHAYHILKALVMETSLSQAILLHLDLIIPACVSGFSSELWAVRNGALQLFGVLLPRICGQKKVSDDESEYNLVSSSELFARCPSLEIYLIHQLEKCVKLHKEGKLSSELIPVLSIIVKLSPPQDDVRSLFTNLKISLLELLDIPVWKIRDLVSSILSIFMSIEEILLQIKNIPHYWKSDKINSNAIHGKLSILQKYLKRNNNILIHQNTIILKDIEEIYPYILKMNCPIIEGLMLDIALLLDVKKETSGIILKSINLNKKKQYFNVGQVFYDNRLALLSLKTIDICGIPAFIEQQMESDISIQIDCFQFLSSKLHLECGKLNFSNETNLESWRNIYISANKFIVPGKHPSVIKVTLEFALDLCFHEKMGFYILDADVTNFLEEQLIYFLENSISLSISAFSLTMWSLIIKHTIKKGISQISSMKKWSMFFNSFCQPRCPDILRKQAACSVSTLGVHLLKCLAKQFKNNQNQEDIFYIFTGICEGSLLLLQDEDEEIRNIACEYPSKIDNEYEIELLQFNVGINVIFQYMYLLFDNNNDFLFYLWNKLQNFPSTVKILQSAEKSVKTNLFEQEYVNVFAEPLQLLIKYKNLFQKSMESLYHSDYATWEEHFHLFFFDLKLQLEDVLILLHRNETNDSILNQGFAFPHQVFLAFKKLACMVEVLEAQKQFICPGTYLKILQKEILCHWKCIENKLTFIDSWFLKQL